MSVPAWMFPAIINRIIQILLQKLVSTTFIARAFHLYLVCADWSSCGVSQFILYFTLPTFSAMSAPNPPRSLKEKYFPSVSKSSSRVSITKTPVIPLLSPESSDNDLIESAGTTRAPAKIFWGIIPEEKEHTAIAEVLAGDESLFHLIPFEKINDQKLSPPVYSQRKSTEHGQIQRELGNKAKNQICRAVCNVVAEDLLPFSFAEQRECLVL